MLSRLNSVMGDRCIARLRLLGELSIVYIDAAAMTQTPHDEFWVFGYGSLIWRPGFDFVDRAPARLTGLHRALCVYSFVHRGTPEKPGLVLGLDRGGACPGMAYRVDIKRRDETIAYLREREQVTSVYLETWRQVTIAGQRRVRALAFCVDRGHAQYAGRLTLDQQVHLVRQGHGRSGNNRDYVLSTVDALEALGCRDRDLHLLAQRLRSAPEREPARPELTEL
jgi:cation transport protein ChaC